MQRFVLIPPESLNSTTLESLLISYLTRQGYDTSDTSESAIHNQVAIIIKKLQRQELFLVQDLETQASELLSPSDAKKWL